MQIDTFNRCERVKNPESYWRALRLGTVGERNRNDSKANGRELSPRQSRRGRTSLKFANAQMMPDPSSS